MNIWNKILLGFIIVAAIAEVFLGAKTLNIHRVWRESRDIQISEIERLDAEIDTTTNVEVDDADPTLMGVKQLLAELGQLSIGRGRVWANCVPSPTQAAGPTIRVTIETEDGPAPNGIFSGDLVFVFEGPPPVIVPDPLDPMDPLAVGFQPVLDDTDTAVADASAVADEPLGPYLGTFNVIGAAGRQVTLEPAYSLTPEEIQEIADSTTSGKSWILHDVMPRDDPAILASLTEEQILAMFPTDFADEIINGLSESEIRDLFSGNPDLAEELISNGPYRKLRDYEYLFIECYRERAAQQSRREQLEADTLTMQTNITLCDEQIALRQSQKEEYDAQILLLQDELSSVEAHRVSLQERIDDLRLMIDEKLLSNASLVAELARMQEEALTAARDTVPVAVTP